MVRESRVILKSSEGAGGEGGERWWLVPWLVFRGWLCGWNGWHREGIRMCGRFELCCTRIEWQTECTDVVIFRSA